VVPAGSDQEGAEPGEHDDDHDEQSALLAR
jgi:hypothetical protein